MKARCELGQPRMGRALVALLLVSALGRSAADVPVGADGWLKVSRGGVSVTCRHADARYARRVAEICEARFPGLASSMSLDEPGPLRIFIASSDDEFSDLAMRAVPEWGVGAAFPDEGLIVLKSPRIVRYPLQMEDVVVHELAHIAAGRVLSGVARPHWFDEGVAMAVAGEWRLSQSAALASSVLSGHLIPLAELEETFPHGASRAALAYAESFQAVRFLMERANVGTPGELVAAVAGAGSFDLALATLTGFSRTEFEGAFERSVARRFGWTLAVSGWSPVFLVAGVLVLVAFFVRTKRARGRMAGWEAEEEREPGRPSKRRLRSTSWE